MPVISVRVDDETYKQLKKIAEEEGVKLSSLVRQALRDCLNIGIEKRPDIERRIDELEERLQRLEKQMKRLAGLDWYMEK